MLKEKIFMTSPKDIGTASFYPRNYSPSFMFAKNKLQTYPMLDSFLKEPIKGGSTPSAFLFTDKEDGVPFVKTSAILRHFINVNDLYYINKKFHNTTIKRSITKPYDVIYSMTGKFMGKAALCPPTISEMNMSQNSVVLKTNSPLESAHLCIFLNSEINRIQVKGNYSITKQKFLNQGKISQLRVVPFMKQFISVYEDYINAVDSYYDSIRIIQDTINQFNLSKDFGFGKTELYSFEVNPLDFSKKMLVPNYYREDISETIYYDGKKRYLTVDNLTKGVEVGSENYLETGIPFIKTSDIVNYDIDKEPNCFCPEYIFSENNQNIKYGDVLFTKDGKPGEVAIVEEDSKFIYSSGLVKYTPKDEYERYWLFLLLSSKYGEAFFRKWFVVASTMTHLRKDFFDDFYLPNTKEYSKYVNKIKNAFKEKKISYKKIITARDIILENLIKD